MADRPQGRTSRRPAVHAGGAAGLVVAPAKLTLSLRISGVRADGYHELRAEMVSIDLCDELWIDPAASGMRVTALAGSRAGDLGSGPDNLVRRALALADRSAGVSLTKRIPVQGGLGGGSSDAAAVLRWAGVDDASVAASLGADVPFCVAGGRALVTGVGECIAPLPFEPRSFVLVVPPFGVDTAAVYREWDRLSAELGEPWHDDPNDLARPATSVEPRLSGWRGVLGEATGLEPVLAGSGSTWFVEGRPEDMGMAEQPTLSYRGEEGMVIGVRTLPAS